MSWKRLLLFIVVIIITILVTIIIITNSNLSKGDRAVFTWNLTTWNDFPEHQGHWVDIHLLEGLRAAQVHSSQQLLRRHVSIRSHLHLLRSDTESSLVPGGGVLLYKMDRALGVPFIVEKSYFGIQPQKVHSESFSGAFWGCSIKKIRKEIVNCFRTLVPPEDKRKIQATPTGFFSKFTTSIPVLSVWELPPLGPGSVTLTT